MRIRLIFNVQNVGGIIPFHHQNILSDFFKNLLQKESSLSLFNLYNFSGIKGRLIAVKEGLKLSSNKATIVFSAPDEKFVNLVIKSLFKEKFISVGQVFLEVIDIEKEENIYLNSNEAKYIGLSPLMLIHPLEKENDPKRFVNPLTDEFSDLLYESTISRLEQLGKFSQEELSSFNKFQIIPDHSFLAKIKDGEKKYSRIYATYVDGKKYEVRGYTLPFTLFAPPPVQNFIFECGIGELTTNGLGMLDLATQEFSERVIGQKAQLSR